MPYCLTYKVGQYGFFYRKIVREKRFLFFFTDS